MWRGSTPGEYSEGVSGVNLYQSDVRSLSDAELEMLSGELQEEYCRGSEEEYWLDDAAEARYYEMHREQHRRFVLAHPDWKPLIPSEWTKAFFESMRFNLEMLNETFNAEFTEGKIGGVITVRQPVREATSDLRFVTVIDPDGTRREVRINAW